MATVDAEYERKVLLSVSIGEISIMEASSLLGLPDAGHLFRRLVAAGLPKPNIPTEMASRQVRQASVALDRCAHDSNATDSSQNARGSPDETD